MPGNSMAEGFLLSHKAPGHRGGSLEGVCFAFLIWLGTIAAIGTIDVSQKASIALFFWGFAIGIVCGWLLTRSINKRRAKRRALFETEYRAEQERETQRKLVEAKARGEI